MEKIYIILLANLVFFAKTLSYKYCSDDIPVWHASKNQKHGFFKRRWLQLEGSIRVSQQQDHALTTILHAITGVFVYLAFGASDVSFIAALLFSFNPINNQGSVWISGRSYVLATLGILVSMVFPIIAPVAIILVMHYPIGFCMAGILGIMFPYMLIFVLLGAGWHFRRVKGLIGNKVEFEMFAEDKRIEWKKIIIVIKTFSFYTIHALIPIKTTFYHSFMQSMAGSGKEKAYSLDRFFYIGLIISAAFIWKLFFTPWDLVSFGLVWWVVGLAPFLNAFRISQEIAERYAYAPLPGLMIVLATILQPYPIVIAAVLAMYATKLWFYMDNFQDDYYLVEGSCLNDPSAWFVWHIRALRRWDVQSHKEAMILWTMAKMIHPKEFKVLFNLATMLKIHKQDKEAAAFMDQAACNIPKGQEVKSQGLINEWKKGHYQVLI